MNTVAEIMIQQIGGNKFIAMTGAKNFTCTENSLSFHLPKKLIKNKGNIVTITLEADDTYSLRFAYLNKNLNLIEESVNKGVYYDQLVEIISQETGLTTLL